MVIQSMIDGNDVIQHLSPAWQDEADFIVKAHIEESLPKAWEQLWAKQLDSNTFRICCIPFAIYGVNLGDTVMTDNDYVVLDVTHRSSHSTFRVWFGEEESESERARNREQVLKMIRDRLGCLVEWYSRDLLAIDAANSDQAEKIGSFLLDISKNTAIIIESGEG